MTGHTLMDTFFTKFFAVIAMIPFSASTWFILFTMLFFVLLFFSASRDPNSKIKWEDMIVENRNGKASPYKLGYMVGIVVSTWIVIKLSDADHLGLDIFGAYLAYLLGGAGFNSYIKNQSGGGGIGRNRRASDPQEPQQ